MLFFDGFRKEGLRHGNVVAILTLIGFVSGLVVFGARVRRWSLFRLPVLHVLLLWNAAYLMAYGFVLNPPAYPWYYTPLAPGIAAIVALPTVAIHGQTAGGLPGAARRWGLAICLMLAFIAAVNPLRTLLGPVGAKYEGYRLASEWLNKHAPEGASVGANEIGVLGYFYDRGPIIDGLGLVTPGVAAHVSRRNYDWYVHHYRPDYLMFNHPHRETLEAMVEADWFDDVYALSTVVSTTRREVAIYQRRGASSEVQTSSGPGAR